MIGIIPGAAAMITRNIALLKWLIPAGALAAAGIYVWSLRGDLDRARAAIEAQRAAIERAADANQTLNQTIDAMQQHQARQIEALQAQNAASLSRAIQTQKALNDVRTAPPSADAPMAPVLLDALERLRSPGTAPVDRNPNHPPGSARPSPGLPAQP